MPDTFIHAIPGEIKGLDDRRTDLLDLLQLGDVATPIPPAMARGYGSPPLAALHIGDKAYDAASLLAEIGRRTSEPQAQMSATGRTIDLKGVTSPATVPLMTAITAVQEGTGDPSPDNVRPITPVQTVEIRYGTNGESPEQVLTADLPEAVYGGTLDWATGLLTVTHKSVLLDGKGATETGVGQGVWTKGSNNFFVDLVDMAVGVPPLCSSHPYVKKAATQMALGQMTLGSVNAGIQRVSFGNPGNAITLDEWVAMCDEQPIQLVYTLKEPYTIQLTPQQLQLMTGDSVLITTGGETTVEYRISLQRYIDDKFAQVEAAVLAMGANI